MENQYILQANLELSRSKEGDKIFYKILEGTDEWNFSV